VELIPTANGAADPQARAERLANTSDKLSRNGPTDQGGSINGV